MRWVLWAHKWNCVGAYLGLRSRAFPANGKTVQRVNSIEINLQCSNLYTLGEYFHSVVRRHSVCKNSTAWWKSHSRKALMIAFFVASFPFRLRQSCNIADAWSMKSGVSAFRLPLSWSAFEISSSSKRLSKSSLTRSAFVVIRRMSFIESFFVPVAGLKSKMYQTVIGMIVKKAFFPLIPTVEVGGGIQKNCTCMC